MSILSRLTVLTAALILCSASGPAGAQDAITPSFRAAIKELLVIQQTANVVGDQMTFGMAEQFLQSLAAGGIEITEPMKQLTLAAARDEFGKKFADVDYLTELYAPIYAQHFDEKELEKMAVFWKSPVGQKTLEVMPTLTQESYVSLQQSSYALVPQFQKSVEAKFREAGIAMPSAPGAPSP